MAQSDACPHQAFFYPPATLGLQFHLESTTESIDRLIRNCGDELIPAPYVQTDPEIKSQDKYIGPSNIPHGSHFNSILKDNKTYLKKRDVMSDIVKRFPK